MKLTLETFEKIGSRIIDAVMIFVGVSAVIPIAIGVLVYQLFLLVISEKANIILSSEAWMVLWYGMVCLVIVVYVFCILVMLKFGGILKQCYHKYIKGQGKKHETEEGKGKLQENVK